MCILCFPVFHFSLLLRPVCKHPHKFQDTLFSCSTSLLLSHTLTFSCLFQFAGSSSVPAHVEMMGFLGMGNNPMVGATVAVAVAVQNSLK